MVYSIILSAALAYFLGSINTSILVSRLFGVSDIRQKGSGNAGATNTLRVVGKKAAVLVVIGDALKGIVSILGARVICSIFDSDISYSVYISSVMVVFGHVFPVYFGFKGGKGIMTSIAVIFVLNYKIGLILVGIFAILVLLFNYVSLGSCICALSYPFIVAFMEKGNTSMLISAVIIAVIAILKHRTNIVRLLNGTESKLFKSKSNNQR